MLSPHNYDSNLLQYFYNNYNLTKIPDLEFPSSSEQLISTVHESWEANRRQDDATNRVKHIYDG